MCQATVYLAGEGQQEEEIIWDGPTSNWRRLWRGWARDNSRDYHLHTWGRSGRVVTLNHPVLVVPGVG